MAYFMLVLGFLVTAVVAASIPRDFISRGKYNNAKTVQLCGRDLADGLSLVCEQYGGINGPTSHAVAPRMSGPRKGIVDECCHSACSFRTLLSYCANYTSQEESSSAPSAKREGVEEELDNRVIGMLFGPPAPRRPRRFGKTGGCIRRCRLRCGQRAIQDDAENENNRRRNEIQSVGTVPPELQRRPVIVHRRY